MEYMQDCPEQALPADPRDAVINDGGFVKIAFCLIPPLEWQSLPPDEVIEIETVIFQKIRKDYAMKIDNNVHRFSIWGWGEGRKLKVG